MLSLALLNYYLHYYLLFNNSATSTYTSPACLVPLSVKIRIEKIVLFIQTLTFLDSNSLVSLLYIILHSIPNCYLNVATPFMISFLSFTYASLSPLFQMTEIVQANFKPSFNVDMSAKNKNLKHFCVILFNNILFNYHFHYY